MTRIIALLFLVGLMAAPYTARTEVVPTATHQNYVYAVWGCTRFANGAWRCLPSDPTRFATLAACQAERARTVPRVLPDRFVWWQCYQLPVWTPAEPIPEVDDEQ